MDGTGKTVQNSNLAKATDLMAKSDYGAMLLELAKTMGVSIVAEPLGHDALACFLPEHEAIITNQKAPPAALAASLAHEIIHAWQKHSGFWPDDNLSPQDAITANRTIEATAQTGSLIMCRELEQKGYLDPMRVHEQMGYSAQVAAIRSMNEPGRAFLAWFSLSWCRDRYDTATLDSLSSRTDALEKAKAAGFRPLTPDMLTGMCALPPNGASCLDRDILCGSIGVFSEQLSPGNTRRMQRLEAVLSGLGDEDDDAQEMAIMQRLQSSRKTRSFSY